VTIWTGDRRKLRVLDVVAVDEEDSPYVGLLKVEPAAVTSRIRPQAD
jgi:hypothetical protein